ncbi:hypothetical protein Pyn_41098 [Prunus yedoensis var. nudiflora]|uniref:RING-type domain-containing protein n=1 Tax=Prunus yedoensis var. nudiflora TaxID=2094558 RepID=A0A314YDA0_PRUYE|nr:hypothetical protein Pyn_41098 [Prunus yedoensis var. nudiflora]
MLLSLLNLLNMIKIHYHFSFKPDQYHKNNNHTIDDHGHQLVENNLAAAAAPSPCMEGSQAVREPCNCSHAFHRECLDVWIDEGQLTCPLCRSELVPNSTPKTKDHKEMGDFEEDDPWRSERMVYLFGEDHLMSYSIG